MLNVIEDTRPESATHVYHPDIDLDTLKNQMRQKSAELAQLVDNGAISLSIRQPTQTELAALVITITSYTAKLYQATAFIEQLARGLGRGSRDIEIDFALPGVGINIEEYEPSAFKKQVAFDVATLPA